MGWSGGARAQMPERQEQGEMKWSRTHSRFRPYFLAVQPWANGFTSLGFQFRLFKMKTRLDTMVTVSIKHDTIWVGRTAWDRKTRQNNSIAFSLSQ